jgi:hypothetical protein
MRWLSPPNHKVAPDLVGTGPEARALRAFWQSRT